MRAKTKGDVVDLQGRALARQMRELETWSASLPAESRESATVREILPGSRKRVGAVDREMAMGLRALGTVDVASLDGPAARLHAEHVANLQSVRRSVLRIRQRLDALLDAE